MKFDFKHIDPRTGMPRMVQNETNKIQMMNILPSRSGWIYVLQNRIGLNTVGNIRYKKKLWYDYYSHSVSSDENMEDAEPLRSYILPGCGRPGGWIYASDVR